MDLSAVVDVALGLMLVYLFLAMVSSAIQEWISRLFSLRSATLRQGIYELLHDPQMKDLAERVCTNPLVQQLAPKGVTKSGFDAATAKLKMPSYLPPSVFANALLDAVLPEGGHQPRTVQELQSLVEALPPGPIRKTLLTHINNAGNDLAKVRKEVETWFDNAMDRVSGWYRRKIQVVLLVIALLLAAAFNADTFTIAHTLWSDAALRTALAGSATALVSGATETCKQASDPKACLTEAVNVPALRSTVDAGIGLPLGWSAADFTCKDASGKTHTCSFPTWAFLLRVLGWIVTGIAVSLGAPFWFDAIGKLVSLRAAGTKPKPSQSGTA